MEAVHLHSMVPWEPAELRALTERLLPAALLHRKARLGVQQAGPWRPMDLWPSAPEVLLWSASFVGPWDLLVNDKGLEVIADHTMQRRQAPAHPAERVLKAWGNGLVTVWSDAAKLAYAALYRDRQLRWSLMVIDGVRLVRCDGVQVEVESPLGWFPEEDRTGVLLSGVQRLLLAPLALEPEERLVVPEALESLFSEAAEEPWVLQGEWVEGEGGA